jgi:hypothetical protein
MSLAQRMMMQSGGASLFVPTDITGIAGWWRADLLVTQAALAVSAWGDSSGSGDASRILVQSVAGKKPTINATDAAYNNQSTLSFASASSQQLDSTGAWVSALSQPYTIFLVGQDGGAGFQGWASNTGSSVQISYGNGSANMVMYAGSFLASNQGASSSPKVVGAVFNGATSDIYEGARTPRATGDAGATALAQLTIGAIPGAGLFLNGKIAECVVYSKALSAPEIDQLCTYLTDRYAIGIGA